MLQARGQRAVEKPGAPGWLLHLIYILEQLGVEETGTLMDQSSYFDISCVFLGVILCSGPLMSLLE